MSNFKIMVFIIFTAFSLSVFMPVMFLDSEKLAGFLVILAIIWAPVMIPWVRNYRSYRESTYSSFEEWWIHNNAKNKK